MEREELYQAIFRRRSVRKYEERPLDEDVLARIREFASSVQPMLPGIRTEIRLLPSGDTKGMMRASAPHYLAFFSEEKEGFAANAGFMLQQVDLFLSASGIGSCWLAASKPVRGIKGSPGMEFVIMLALGRPAEELYRKNVAEFKRKALSEVTTIKGMDDILEAARLAPSGTNNQSWFFNGGDGTINAYSERSMVFDRMNRINVGISLCHLWLAATHAGKSAEVVLDGGARTAPPKGYTYIASLSLR